MHKFNFFPEINNSQAVNNYIDLQSVTPKALPEVAQGS